MPRKNILTVLYLFVMHDGYRKLIVFLNFIKHCDWFFKFLNSVLECSDLLHIVQNSFINIQGKYIEKKYSKKYFLRLTQV